jgi:hypothetical protein
MRKPRAALEQQLEKYRRELAEAREHLGEALEQQTATSKVLRVISNSPTEIQPVLDAVGENAARLCDANNAVIFRLEGDLLRQVASYGGLPTTSHPVEGLPVNRGRVTGRAVFERRTIHIYDLAAEEDDFPEGSRDARRDGHRTTLATPLLREPSFARRTATVLTAALSALFKRAIATKCCVNSVARSASVSNSGRRGSDEDSLRRGQ